MDRFKAMRVFTSVVSSGGFAVGGRRLGVSPPVATRAIASLELLIGAQLLHRTTRKLHLTEAGARYFDDCQRILAELEEAEASAASSHGEPQGLIAITAPRMFGRLFVSPILLEFLTQHPRVTGRSLLVDRVVDLVDEGVDVAVRIAHLPDSSLRAQRVGSLRRVVCATPRYLAEHGVPKRPSDLSRFPIVVLAPSDALTPWSFAGSSGTETFTPSARLLVNTAELAVAAALEGHGLIRVLSYQAAEELRTGKLRVLLASFEPPPIPVHVVHHEGRRVSAKVRRFVDLAVRRLREERFLQG